MAIRDFKAPPLPKPEQTYSFPFMAQLVRILELYFTQLDSFAPNQAESYKADKFYGGQYITGISTSTTGTITVADSVTFIPANATSGNVTVNLPAAAQNTGRTLTVKKTDASANTVTLDGNSAETIDGAATYVLSARYDTVTVLCDGSNWHVISVLSCVLS